MEGRGMSDDGKSANDQTLLSLPEAARITFPDGRVSVFSSNWSHAVV
jgi:hypothetical protein